MPLDENEPPPWTKVTLPLPAKHQWKVKSGCKAFIADGGAVRLEFPEDWVIRHGKKDVIHFHDRPPPDDVARISLTVFKLPRMPADWWTGLPLEKLMREAMLAEPEKDSAPAPTPEEAAVVLATWKTQRRQNIELGWLEKRPWIDPENGKPIRCRQALARGRRTQILLTFDTYEHAGDKYDEVWDHLLKSLRLESPVNLDGSGKN